MIVTFWGSHANNEPGRGKPCSAFQLRFEKEWRLPPSQDMGSTSG